MYEKKKTLNERHLKSPDICLLKALSNYNLIHVHFEWGRKEGDCGWVGGESVECYGTKQMLASGVTCRDD